MAVRNLRLRWASAVAVALVLAACSTPTPYQPLGSRGEIGGYASQRLEDNRYRVRFVGNSLTSRERVENYLLYRAAELTVGQGYACFTIADRDTDRHVTTRVTPDYIGPYPYWAPYWRLRGPWGWHFYDPWIGGPFHPTGYDVDVIDSFEATAEIVMRRGNGDCADEPRTFRARQVMANLEPMIERPVAEAR